MTRSLRGGQVPDGGTEKTLVRRRGMTSHMSNTKWRELFTALDRADLKLKRCRIKCLDVQEPLDMGVPCPASFRGLKYFETIEVSSIPFVAIEWLEFPAMIARPRTHVKGVPPLYEPQDLDQARAIIEALGRFPLQTTATGLRVVGHSHEPLV